MNHISPNVQRDNAANKTPEKTSTTKKTQKKKKILKGFLDGATSVLFTVLCLAPGKIAMGKLLLVRFYFRF